MNDRTIAAYRLHAGVAIRNWRGRRKTPPFLKEVTRLALKRFGPAPRLLDLGCGPGEDSRWFVRRGFRVTGVDAVGEFLRAARKRAPGAVFVRRDLRDPVPGGPYSVIWANASLIHLKKSDLPAVLRRLRGELVPGGLFAATVYHGRGESVFEGSFIPGRFFARYLKAELVGSFRRAGYTILNVKTLAHQVRRGRWIQLLAEKS